MKVYLVSLDDYKSMVTHWIDLYKDGNSMTYFDNFGVKHISKEIKNCIGNKHIITIIFKTQAHGSLMCGYFGIEFIVFMFKGKTL